MNIFILDKDIQKSAEYLVDRHVVKMVLEHCQVLCSAFPKGTAPYRQTHYNHPCNRWSRESRQNYVWLLEYTRVMFNEYTRRYGKRHKSEDVYLWCSENYHQLNLPSKGLTPFAQAMPEQYRNEDPVKAYRDYYMGEKRHIAQWKTQAPKWWT